LDKENTILIQLAEKFGLKPPPVTATSGYKTTEMIYGAPKVGKTTAAFSRPGNILCISYDGMSKDIKRQMVKKDPTNDERIQIFDIGIMTEQAQEGLIDDPDIILDHGVLGYEYTKAVLLEAKDVDWIALDGVDFLVNYAEMVMRKHNELKPYEGFKNLNLWKERNYYVRKIHTLALQKARLGVILIGWESLVSFDEEGKSKTIKEPKWVDSMKTSSGFVFHITQQNFPSQGKHYHYAFVESSKNEDLYRTGERIDLSDSKPLMNFERYNYLRKLNGMAPIQSIIPTVAIENEQLKATVPPKTVIPPKETISSEKSITNDPEIVQETDIDSDDSWGV